VLTLDYLPIGVLPPYLPEPIELEEIASSDFDSFARRARAGQQPFGYAPLSQCRNEMPVVAVMNVRYSFETEPQSLSDGLLSCEPLPERAGPSRHIKDAIIREVRHYSIQVMPVKGREEISEYVFAE
jgi:hypothetical protein